VSGNWSVTCSGRLDCGVLEKIAGGSAPVPRGPGKVMARPALALLWAALPSWLCGRATW